MERQTSTSEASRLLRMLLETPNADSTREVLQETLRSVTQDQDIRIETWHAKPILTDPRRTGVHVSVAARDGAGRRLPPQELWLTDRQGC